MRLLSLVLFSVVGVLPALAGQIPLTCDLKLAPDGYTRSNYREVKTEHLDLDLSVHMGLRRLRGTARLTVHRLKPTDYMILDTRDLDIERVTVDHKPVKWSLGEDHPLLGRALTLELPPSHERQTVEVQYKVASNNTIVNWLDASSSASGAPGLFIVSEPTLARGWIPTPDTPQARFTSSTRLVIEDRRDLLPLMSAVNPESIHPSGTYTFKNPYSMPPYLLSLTIDNYRYHAFDAHTGVYATPDLLDRAVHEFQELPAVFRKGQELMGPYRWGRYDLVVLRKAFAFGGMENPLLTYASPTLLAGDGAGLLVVEHEFVHSYVGNLTTHANWSEIVLTEGLTMYLQFELAARVADNPLSADLDRYLAYLELMEHLKKNGQDAKTVLIKNDDPEIDPEEYFDPVTYNKGLLFFERLAQVFGKTSFHAFLRDYFKAFAFQNMNLEGLGQLLEGRFGRDFPDWKQLSDYEIWLRQPGLPARLPLLTSELYTQIHQARHRFLVGDPVSDLGMDHWITPHWAVFLRSLPGEVSAQRLRDLDLRFGFSHGKNRMLQEVWFARVIQAGDYERVKTEVADLLANVGRMRVLKPIYDAILAQPGGVAEARRLFEASKNNYMPVAANMLEGLIRRAEEKVEN